jgi:hypothetical protein
MRWHWSLPPQPPGSALVAAFCSPPQPAYSLFKTVPMGRPAPSTFRFWKHREMRSWSLPPTSAFGLSGTTGHGVAWTATLRRPAPATTAKTGRRSPPKRRLPVSPTSVILHYPERVEALVRESRVAHRASVNGQIIQAMENASVLMGAVGTGGGATISIHRNCPSVGSCLRGGPAPPMDYIC